MSARTVGLLLWLLVGGLGAGAMFWQMANPPRPPMMASAVQHPLELPAVAPVQPFRLPPLDQYDDIVVHPLFIAARKPEPPPPEEEQPQKPAAGPEKKPMLLGVLIAPGSPVALLRPDEPNAKVLRLRPGESVGDWQLETILPNRVILRRGQATQELMLERARKPAKSKVPPRPPVRQARDAAPPAGVPAPPQPNAPPPAAPAPPQ